MSTLFAQYEEVRPQPVQVPVTPDQDFIVGLAFTPAEVRESQALRYKVFADEMGADLDTPEAGYDIDHYDAFCQHIIVRDQVTREVVASTRVLLDRDARLAGGFYSENEFDISGLRGASGGILEIGRTCVHPDYRSGTAISLLWSGLARFIDVRQYQHMIGCASIPMGENGSNALAIHALLKEKYELPADLRVTPRLPLPERQLAARARESKPALPPLLKAYIRLGARIGGEPCWDPKFDVADLFIVLSPADLQRRYAKHFFKS